MDALLTIEEAEGGYAATLQLDAAAPLRGRFVFNRHIPSLERAFRDLDLPNCARDQIKWIGHQLFQGSFGGPLRDHLKQALTIRAQAGDAQKVRLRLITPPALRWLPWEAVFDDALLHMGTRPDWTIRHEPAPAEVDQVVFPAAPKEKIRVLVVVPSQTNLDFTSERLAIKTTTLRLKAGTAEFCEMQGGVTLTALTEKLAEGNWDVVHYIGHGLTEMQPVMTADGRAEEQQAVKILLNQDSLGGKAYIDELSFASAFMGSKVRVVVLSCCLGASYSSTEVRSLAGLGPYLLRAGVPAVVGMRYVVTDSAATEFSRAFYESLFHTEPGSVDMAVQAGRRTLYGLSLESEQRAFVTPVLYCTAAGATMQLKLQPLPPPPPPPLPLKGGSKVVVIPPPLEALLREGKCFVIAGERLATMGAERTGANPATVPPTLATLAERIVDKTQPRYPRPKDLTEASGSGEEDRTWEAFERICQYYKSSPDGGRLALGQEIGESFADRLPPPLLLQLADWRVPGIFYTHFDGFLRQKATNKGWQVANNPRNEISGDDRKTLVLLRGWAYEDDTLRLTREELWDVINDIAHMSATIKRLARVRGRALLVLGASPSDALVQFLVNTLFGDQAQRDEKTIFFACAEPDPVVKSYWHRFQKLKWLGDQPLDELVQAIDLIMREER